MEQRLKGPNPYIPMLFTLFKERSQEKKTLTPLPNNSRSILSLFFSLIESQINNPHFLKNPAHFAKH